jgi:azurin
VPLTLVTAATAMAIAVAAFGATILSNPTQKFNLAYAKKTLSATAGSVTLTSRNTSSVFDHNIALRKGTTAKGKAIVKGKVVGKNGVSTVTAKLAKGKYRFFCTVAGHEKGGMWGILTVK